LRGRLQDRPQDRPQERPPSKADEMHTINELEEEWNNMLSEVLQTEECEQNMRVLKHTKGEEELRQKSYEDHIRALTLQYDDLRSKYQQAIDLNSRLSDYENKISLFSKEVPRLNEQLRLKLEDVKRLAAERDELERRVRQQEENALKVGEYETKIPILTQ
jgi:chromosome segregation ATPase